MKRSLLLTLIVSLCMVAIIEVDKVAAQAVPGIPQQLNTILEKIGDLQNTLNNLSAPDQSNIRVTPPAIVDSAHTYCEFVNVSAFTRTIKAELIDGGNGQVVETRTVTIDAGKSGSTNVSDVAHQYYCRFTVTDGSRSDIRGTLAVFTSFSEPDKLSIPAE